MLVNFFHGLREAGVPVGGHVPGSVPLREATAAGMDFIEHLTGFLPALQADDSAYAQMTAAERRALNRYRSIALQVEGFDAPPAQLPFSWTGKPARKGRRERWRGATIVTNNREIAADDYFQGMFATALEEGEIITEVKFPVPEAAHYEKLLQPASRFPLVAAFVAKFSDGVRVAITGASNDGVFRWAEAEAALSANFSADAIAGLTLDGSNMISDLHGSGDYRAHLVGVTTRRAVAAIG